MAVRGKIIAITGASSGIGAATAIELARQGAKVMLGARRHDRLVKVVEQCNQAAGQQSGGGGEVSGGGKGGGAASLDCDVSREEDVKRFLAETVRVFGRLDVAIANAGYGFLARIHDTTEEQFDAIVRTNVKGTWYVMTQAHEIMKNQPPLAGEKYRGHIIAVSSGAARRGMPLYGLYSMTKAAQLSLCEAMRVELKASGIYVSSVHPLTTATEFFDVASSKSRLKSRGIGPAQSADAVARKIARLIRRPRPELWPQPLSAYALSFAAAFPRVADWFMANTVGSRSR
jgi:NAD(P)-dependent dehydrogenase (short-subunit alcohol dehydrogenase family)